MVISDNIWICSRLCEIIAEGQVPGRFTFAYSYRNPTGAADFGRAGIAARPINVRGEQDWILENFDLVLSAHCKQLFPPGLVKGVRCVNVHPGLNPHNRGWFPQVFSILNGLPLGATLHVIDEELDHGPIIGAKEVPVFAWDTSLTAYNRVQEAEVELLREWLPRIVAGRVETTVPAEQGNLNLKRDYDALLALDLDTVQPVGKTIDRLRALTHGAYRNAYFIDPATGKKVFVEIRLSPED